MSPRLRQIQEQTKPPLVKNPAKSLALFLHRIEMEQMEEEARLRSQDDER